MVKQPEKVDYSVLKKVNLPADIRGLSIAELNALSQEIRELIIHTVASRGGHLASSLGAVELTLALHYVFNTPQDKIIWDVGHQAYAHKIITGRKDDFAGLRTQNGISGFPRREESVYDVFNVGHSGTSISAAAGFTEAGCLKGLTNKVIAVIGDGSMTAGMAFEGLNWTGDRKKNMIIVLNDNEMSISSNVGAMSSYLNRVMTGHKITTLKTDIKRFLNSIPGIGGNMIKFAQRIEEILKTMVVPGALFEEMGFTYVGPLEGHRLDYLIKTFENIKDMTAPVLVHVITKKGKGYEYAEEDPLGFHGVAPFDVETGQAISSPSDIPTYTKVFGQTMVKLARADSRVVAITAAMCEGTGLNTFSQEFPKRFYDVGIAEQHAVTFAAGLALEGLVPVVAIYSTFLQRAYDQIVHDVCLQKLPVVFALDRGGLVGEDGATHQGLFDYTYLRSIPHIIVMAPKDENELQHMIKTAVEYNEGPVAVRFPRGKGFGVFLDEDARSLEIPSWEIVKTGRIVAVLATGSTVHPAIEAAKVLEKEGMELTVVNARFIKPLDAECIKNIASTHSCLLTVEENTKVGGFGSAVLEVLADMGMPVKRICRIGLPDSFVEHGSQDLLRRKYGLNAEGIVSSLRVLAAEQGLSWA